MLSLSCTVRGCAAPLVRAAADYACSRGHSFNVARSGYVNLLQPQERRSKSPGDSKDTVAARARLLDAGHGRPLLDAIHAAMGESVRTLVDLGCGQGYFLAALASRLNCAAAGIDISVHAIDAAARAHPGCTWIVANADRQLPFPDGSVHVAMAITGRTNVAELARVLAPDGRFVVAVPAPDDQVELREQLYGKAHAQERLANLVHPLSAHFALDGQCVVRHTVHLDRAGLSDLLLSTYRGARHRERERLAAIDALDVTQSYELATFRRRSDILAT